MGLEQARLKHKGWRNFWLLRTNANQALNALSVATRLSAKTVQQLPPSTREARFHEFYADSIQGVEVWTTQLKNVPSALEKAESTLAEMALPHAVMVYNDYVVEALTLLFYNGTATLKDPAGSMLGTLEAHLSGAKVVIRLQGEQKRLFSVVKELRNVLIHRNGHADQKLLDARDDLTSPDEASWLGACGAEMPNPTAGERVKLDVRHARGAFWVAANLATEINVELQAKLQRELWADLALADLRQVSADWRRLDQSGKVRAAHSFARHFYGQLKLTKKEMGDAVARAPTEPEIPTRWPRPSAS